MLIALTLRQKRVVDLLHPADELLLVVSVDLLSIIHSIEKLVEIQILLRHLLEELSDTVVHCLVLGLELVLSPEMVLRVGLRDHPSPCAPWPWLQAGFFLMLS